MSNLALTWAINAPVKHTSERVVLMLLADCMNDKTGQCNPSKQYLADKSLLSHEGVRKAIKSMVEAGLISVVEEHRANGSSAPNSYVLNMTTTNSVAPIPPTQLPLPPTQLPPTPNSVGPIEPELEPEENQERERDNAHATPETGFDQFWEAYPRKVAKEAARKAWAKLQPSKQLCVVIADALQMATTSEQWQRDEGRFIPHPATWLNGKRWEDEHAKSDDRMNQPALTGYSAGLQTKENPTATSVSHANRTSGYTSKTPSKFISKQVLVETNTISNLHDWLDTTSEATIHG